MLPPTPLDPQLLPLEVQLPSTVLEDQVSPLLEAVTPTPTLPLLLLPPQLNTKLQPTTTPTLRTSKETTDLLITRTVRNEVDLLLQDPETWIGSDQQQQRQLQEGRSPPRTEATQVDDLPSNLDEDPTRVKVVRQSREVDEDQAKPRPSLESRNDFEELNLLELGIRGVELLLLGGTRRTRATTSELEGTGPDLLRLRRREAAVNLPRRRRRRNRTTSSRGRFPNPTFSLVTPRRRIAKLPSLVDLPDPVNLLLPARRGLRMDHQLPRKVPSALPRLLLLLLPPSLDSSTTTTTTMMESARTLEERRIC